MMREKLLLATESQKRRLRTDRGKQGTRVERGQAFALGVAAVRV